MSQASEAEQDPLIEDLLPATITGVATRLASSTTFTELVSRECELDALWTLCDIALDYTGSDREVSSDEQRHQIASERATLEGLRTLIGQAISSLASSNNDESARLVHEAAGLAGSLS